jgi:proline iminopeptidase
MKKYASLLTLLAVFFAACKSDNSSQVAPNLAAYLAPDTTKVQVGGAQKIEVSTPKGNFSVWTKYIGHNPKVKVLLLNGGPGMSHEYFECMENFLPAAGIEFIYYDQLGTGFSDNPNDVALWDLPRYVEEVEQVRKALQLDASNFVVLGHSWGGILAMEYALKYQANLKGLVISNMMASCIDYGKYAEVLAKQIPADALAEIRALEAKQDFTNPRYMELLTPHYYNQHICRIPWPEPMNRAFGRLNSSLYVTMQGPSEFGISGKLTSWDRKKDLPKLTIPTLTIGAKYDTMDPKHMQWMATQVQNGTYLYCPNGSHMSMYDDQLVYMNGLVSFLKKLEN